MTLLIIFICIALLVLLITWGKLNPFLAFLIVSIIAGILTGIPLANVGVVGDSNCLGGNVG